MAATNLPGTLPSANYMPTYRSNGACDDLAALVAPYSLSRAQLAEATGIADEATVNSWVEQCRPDLAADAPAPLEPVLRYLDETYLPDPANWPGSNAYDEFVLENIAARMLARVVAETFGADRSGNYRELLALIATLVLIARCWAGTDEAFLTLLNAEPTAEAEEYLQEAIANAPESLHPLLTELLLPALRECPGRWCRPSSHSRFNGLYIDAFPDQKPSVMLELDSIQYAPPTGTAGREARLEMLRPIADAIHKAMG